MATNFSEKKKSILKLKLKYFSLVKFTLKFMVFICAAKNTSKRTLINSHILTMNDIFSFSAFLGYTYTVEQKSI